jgi:hypothetical protein
VETSRPLLPRWDQDSNDPTIWIEIGHALKEAGKMWKPMAEEFDGSSGRLLAQNLWSL